MTSLFLEDIHSTDSEDDDYVPDAREISSEDDDEDPGSLVDEIETKKGSKSNHVNKVLGTPKDVEKNKTIHGSPSNEAAGAVDEKKRANDLFKSFLEEVEAEMKVQESVSKSTTGDTCVLGSKTPEVSATSNGCTSNGCDSYENKSEKTVCELFDFAGETVAVSVKDGLKIAATERSTDSALEEKKNNHDKPTNRSSDVKPKGLQSVLGTILNKNKKLSTLEKTSLDWKKFKEEYGISEELQNYNKGRGGYVERKRFLERSDVRSYEIERDMRMTKRKKNC